MPVQVVPESVLTIGVFPLPPFPANAELVPKASSWSYSHWLKITAGLVLDPVGEMAGRIGVKVVTVRGQHGGQFRHRRIAVFDCFSHRLPTNVVQLGIDLGPMSRRRLGILCGNL